MKLKDGDSDLKERYGKEKEKSFMVLAPQDAVASSLAALATRFGLLLHARKILYFAAQQGV